MVYFEDTWGINLEKYSTFLQLALKFFIKRKARITTKNLIRISSVDSEVWNTLCDIENLQVRGATRTCEVTKKSDLPRFGWDDRLERVQVDRHMVHIHKICRGKKWVVIHVGNKFPNLLSQTFKGLHFEGTTNMAFVDKRLLSCPEVGLKCVLNLRKKIDENAQF